jgi:hypothetical protein
MRPNQDHPQRMHWHDLFGSTNKFGDLRLLPSEEYQECRDCEDFSVRRSISTYSMSEPDQQCRDVRFVCQTACSTALGLWVSPANQAGCRWKCFVAVGDRLRTLEGRTANRCLRCHRQQRFAAFRCNKSCIDTRVNLLRNGTRAAVTKNHIDDAGVA